jgi:transcriptional regulator with XRE-family HTH domain
VSERHGNNLIPPRGRVLGVIEGRDAAAGLKRLRKDAGLTPADLAGLLGRGLGWLQDRERGSTRMTRREAEAIAAVLGTDFAGLLEAGAQ